MLAMPKPRSSKRTCPYTLRSMRTLLFLLFLLIAREGCQRPPIETHSR